MQVSIVDLPIYLKIRKKRKLLVLVFAKLTFLFIHHTIQNLEAVELFINK